MLPLLNHTGGNPSRLLPLCRMCELTPLVVVVVVVVVCVRLWGWVSWGVRWRWGPRAQDTPYRQHHSSTGKRCVHVYIYSLIYAIVFQILCLWMICQCTSVLTWFCVVV
jgi:hypothetical protein